MKTIAILALIIASAAASGYGGSSVRLAESAPLRSSGYGAVRSSGHAPASVIRTTQSFETPLRSSGYDAAPLLKSSGYSNSAPLLQSEAVLAAAPVVNHVPIVKYVKEDDNYGTYNYQVQTGDGSSFVETGSMREVGGPEAEGAVNVKQGSYSFQSPEGHHYTVHWTSDENGFRASGAHLPTPPPIPAEILKSLQHSGSDYGSSHSSVRHVSPVVSAPLLKSSSYSHAAPAVVRSTGSLGVSSHVGAIRSSVY